MRFSAITTASRRRAMPRKKKPPVTDAQRKARRGNIVEFNQARDGKPALRHGAQSADTLAGRLPKGFDELQALIDGFYEGWIADAGGLEHVKAKGLADDEGKVQPVLKVIGTYANTLRLNLISAGLERTPRNITRTLEATLQDIAEKEHKDESVADESI